jgi:hypothetical protein
MPDMDSAFLPFAVYPHPLKFDQFPLPTFQDGILDEKRRSLVA